VARAESKADDIGARVHACRLLLADRIAALTPDQWDVESWCSGWRVRDVLGHLVHLAEATQISMGRDVLGNGGRPNRALQRIARQMGDRPVPELAERLRRSADGRFRVLGAPRTVVLGEVVVHGEDALRPLGVSIAQPSDAQQVLAVYRRMGPVAFGAKRNKGVRLVATDTEWSAGSGPEVEGRAVDLLLLLANRHQVRTALTGPGVSAL